MSYFKVMIEILIPKNLSTLIYWALHEAFVWFVSVPIEVIRSLPLGFWWSIGQNKSQNHGFSTTFNKTFPLRMTGTNAQERPGTPRTI